MVGPPSDFLSNGGLCFPGGYEKNTFVCSAYRDYCRYRLYYLRHIPGAL